MNSIAGYALWAAAAMGGLVALALTYVTCRRLLTALLSRRLDRRVQRIETILAQHEREHYGSVERLLFQLGEAQDDHAAEIALQAVLSAEDASVRPRLRKVFDSLGLTARYRKELREASRWTDRAAAARALGLLGAVEAIPELVAALRDPHEDLQSVKRAAADALAQIGAAEALPLLIAQLGEHDQLASPRLADVLAGFGARALQPLLAALREDRGANAHVWIAQVLARIGDPLAVDELRAHLQDSSDRVRISVAEALGRLGDRRAVADLARVAMRDPVGPVRAEAARALGAIGDEVVSEQLVLSLGDPDYWTRLRAVEALELLSPSDTSALERALDDDSAPVRSRAASALSRLGAVRRCIETLRSTDRPAVAKASELLERLGENGVLEPLLGALSGEDMRVRARLCEILGSLADARAGDALVGRLADEAWPVRVRAIEALAKLGRPEDVAELLPLLRDAEEDVRVAVVTAVRQLGVEVSSLRLDVVRQLFEEGNAEVRQGVIEAIGQRPTEEVSTLLLAAMSDPNVDVRLAAVAAASQHSDPRFDTPLIARLADADTRVRSAAALALADLATPAALTAVLDSLVTADREFRETLTDALAPLGATRIGELIGEPKTLEGRLALVWALGKTRQHEALDLLEVQAARPEPEVRAAVAGAIGRFPAESVELLVQRLAGDPNERVRAAAVNALGKLQAARSVERLLAMLNDPDSFVRRRVPIALGQLPAGRGREGLRFALERAEKPDDKAFAIVGYGLLGGELGSRIVLAALADDALRREVEAALADESAAIQRQFRENLRLERIGESGLLDPEALRDAYVQKLRQAPDGQTRLNALRALRALGLGEHGALLPSILRADPEPEVRRLAAVTLAEGLRDEPVRATLLQALKDPVPKVQIAAVRGLSTEADPAHNAVLLPCYLVGDAELTRAVDDALVRANAGNTATFIDELLGHTAESVLCGGANVLGLLGDPRAQSLLEAWLASEDSELRIAAINALGRLGTVSAREAVLGCLGDPATPVRVAAARTLARLPGSLSALERACLDPSVELRLGLARQLGLGSNLGAIALLEALARDPDETVRAEALLGLIQLGDEGALETFNALYAEQTPSLRAILRARAESAPAAHELSQVIVNHRQPAARAAALSALRSLALAPTEVLLRALGDPDVSVRIAAIGAARTSDSAALKARLDGLLRDPDPAVRDAVRKSRIALVPAS